MHIHRDSDIMMTVRYHDPHIYKTQFLVFYVVNFATNNLFEQVGPGAVFERMDGAIIVLTMYLYSCTIQ